MPGLWHWDFEERQAPAATRAPARPPTSQPPPAQPARASAGRYRRRRGAAILILIAAIALIVALATGSSHRRPAQAAREEMGGQRHARPGGGGSRADQAAAVSSVLAYTPFIREGGARGRDVALTFDDGPGPYTPEVLAVLERYHVQATFFVIGRMLRYFGSSTVREIEDGDVVGDHTETHPMLAQLSARDQHEQLFEQALRIEALGGARPTLFRPPYGSFDETTMRELRALHLLMVLWSTDTGDYRQPGVAAIVERALAGAHPGAIILMHDAGGTRSQTIAALPAIISGLRDRGYHIVTVPQLLADDPPPRGEPLPPSLAGD
jgi:peptidoglycan/xylan/chitin deacetylase (PgdA/CDA1 family)